MGKYHLGLKSLISQYFVLFIDNWHVPLTVHCNVFKETLVRNYFGALQWHILVLFVLVRIAK